MNIVCIGDSLTKGYGVTSAQCWVAKLQETLNMTIVNKGVTGDTSTGILSRFSRDVNKETTSKVLIMCGTNDALLYRNMRNVYRNIESMINESLDNNITPVLLFPPKIINELALERWDSKIDYDRAADLLSQLKVSLMNIAKEKDLLFIDLSELMPRDALYYSDGIHLNHLGNDVVFDILKDRIS